MVNFLVLSRAQLIYILFGDHCRPKNRDSKMNIWRWAHLNVLCECVCLFTSERKTLIKVVSSSRCGKRFVYSGNGCNWEREMETESNREEEEEEREGKRRRERVGLVLRWLVWWVGDRESWSITYRSPIACVRGVVGKRGRVRERIGRESVRAWLLKILYSADDK